MSDRLRVLFALPGLHRVNRGAEVALESIAAELARMDGFEVTLMGSGQPRPGSPYRFVHVGDVAREHFEKWPSVPILRNECAYEEMTFAPGLWCAYRPGDFDVTVTCGFPFCNWVLRRKPLVGRRPRHVYVTQNGDWPLYRKNAEYRWFGCDAAVCTNPDFYDAHKGAWPCRLIPNGVDCSVFHPGPSAREELGLPSGTPLVLMTSALIDSKRVLEGIEAVARVPNVGLVVAGDGPLRAEVEARGMTLMPGRFVRRTFAREQMPLLYRSASVFLHMSLDESSANAYIEALATGLPVVTHQRRVTEWTFGEQAFLVNTTDFDAVAEALQQARVGWNAERAMASVTMAQDRYSWQGIARQYADLLLELGTRAREMSHAD